MLYVINNIEYNIQGSCRDLSIKFGRAAYLYDVMFMSSKAEPYSCEILVTSETRMYTRSRATTLQLHPPSF